MTSLTIDLFPEVPIADGVFRGVLTPSTKRFDDGLPSAAIVLDAKEPAGGSRLLLSVLATRGGDFGDSLARAQGLFVVMANPLAGREDAFRQFYVDRHMGEMLALHGILAGALCRSNGEGPVFVSLFPVLDCVTAAASLAAVRGTDRLAPNPEVDRATSRPGFYDRWK